MYYSTRFKINTFEALRLKVIKLNGYICQPENETKKLTVKRMRQHVAYIVSCLEQNHELHERENG